MISKRAVAAGFVSASSVLSILCTNGIARADERGELLTGRHAKVYESPQHFELEFRGALYSPNIDDDPALKGQTPYKDTFGTMKRLLFQLELDYQAFRIPHIGTIGPGVGIGYTEMGNNTFIKGHPDEPAAEQTTLDVYPFYAVAVLRGDAVLRDLRIPLVPYVKGGLGYALWRASNDAGTSSSNGVSGEGHTWGTQIAAGLQFNIDVFDPIGAGNIDQSTGINNTYIFAEYYDMALTGLGQSHALLVGSSGWAFGMAFEF